MQWEFWQYTYTFNASDGKTDLSDISTSPHHKSFKWPLYTAPMKQGVLDRMNVFLLKKGFTIKNFTRSCFDALARRNSQILMIKVLEDANSITREYADEM